MPSEPGVKSAANGAAVSGGPSGIPFARNCTLATAPSGSVAVAVTETLTPTRRLAPAVGKVSATTGGRLASTDTSAGAEVVRLPESSRACATTV